MDVDTAEWRRLQQPGRQDFSIRDNHDHLGRKSLDQRMQIRDEARKKGVWPPPGGADRLITQETKICLPSSFSPLQ